MEIKRKGYDDKGKECEKRMKKRKKKNRSNSRKKE
jgi:hypothetical protein